MSCVVESSYREVEPRSGEIDINFVVQQIVKELNLELKKRGLNKNYNIVHEKNVTYGSMDNYVARSSRGRELPPTYDIYGDNKIEPDGGVVWLRSKNSVAEYPLLISEVKTQGTNGGRKKAGLQKQATGNAIERLGKYVNTFRRLYSYDSIFPFVVFCSGGDFNFSGIVPLDSEAKIQGARLCDFVGRQDFNVVRTKANMPNYTKHNPFTLMAKKEQWGILEITNILREVAIDSLNYYENLIK